jgi:hypothetical protein
MKKRGGFLIVLFVVTVLGSIPGLVLAGGDGLVAKGPERVIIDLNALGEKMDVPMGEVTFPDGAKFNLQQWGREHIEKVIADLQPCFDAPEKTYFVTNSPAPWVTLAVMEALEPLKVRYLYPRADGVELEMFVLEKGVQTPNYDVVFEVVEEGDNLFINLNSDRPESLELKKHTFDTTKLSKVVIPEIPANKHVFIHGKGMFCVLVCVAKNYVRDARSISLAAHDTDYTCAVSRSDDRRAGDVTPRTLPNDL